MEHSQAIQASCVKFGEDGFKTWDEAKLAGEAALKEFLAALTDEEK